MSPRSGRLDVEAIRASVDIVEVIGERGVVLKKIGSERHGLCPFHNEKTPSFSVHPKKQVYYCHGCGASGDVIRFVMEHDGLPFREAAERLAGGHDFTAGAPAPPRRARITVDEGDPRLWLPLMPVPSHAPPLLQSNGSGTCRIWNPKRARWTSFHPTRADEYHHADGRLLAYVLRVEFPDRKITPTITYCIGPLGEQEWCLRSMPSPRPLCGLDELAAKSKAPVLIVEGEKCRAVGASALPMYAALTWPGGSKGIAHTDWSPLKDRDLVLWPDADPAGRTAMLGSVDRSGQWVDGVAQYAHRAGARTIRFVDPFAQPRGWDIADALDVDGWTPLQLKKWAALRIAHIEVRG